MCLLNLDWWDYQLTLVYILYTMQVIKPFNNNNKPNEAQ